MRAPVRLSCLVGAAFALGSCASTPPQRTCPPPAKPACPPAQASGSVWPGGASGPAPESLLEHVPDNALAAVIVRRPALAPLLDWLDRAQGMRVELARYLSRTVGLDLTAVEGAVAFATQLGPQPSVAVLLRMRQGAPASSAPGMRGTPAGSYRGVALIAIDRTAVAASLPTGLGVGQADAVNTAIDVAQGRVPGLQSGSLLGELRRTAGRGAQLLAAVHLPSAPALAPRVQPLGLQLAVMTLSPEGKLTLRVSGDPSGLQQVLQLARAGTAMGLAALEHKMRQETQGSDVAKGVGAIVGYYQARSLLDELEPELVDGQLVSSYTLPKLEGSAGLVAYAGVLAAVAIPAFVKYIRKSKTVEATEGLEQLKAALVQYHAGRGRAGQRFRFPRSVGWTPATSCCKARTAPKCAGGDVGFGHPTWRALRFKIDDPHYYQYRLTSSGQGSRAKVVIEARGDLDCDDKHASFSVTGTVTSAGLEFSGTVIADETE